MKAGNEKIERIKTLGGGDVGRKAWKEEAGYHTKSLVETNTLRFKLMFRNRFRSRQLESQKKELDVKLFIMNMTSQKGMMPKVKSENRREVHNHL